MSTRITNLIEEKIEESLPGVAMGDKVLWDAAFTLQPQIGPTAMLFFQIPSGLIGHAVGTVVPIPMEGPVENVLDGIPDLLRQVLEGLREQRSKMIAEGNGQSPGDGIIVP